MLVLHKSSSCDICMEDYDLEILTKSPHVISCGHVLCLTCIDALSSTICPLCRSDFTLENLKKLHVNMSSEMETSTASVDAQATFLLERIALVSDEDCPKEDVMTVMNDVNTWLCEQDDTFSNIPLRSAFNALFRLKTQEYHGNSDLTDELQTARGVEQSLITQLEMEQEVTMALRNDLESNLRDADDTIQTLRIDNDRLKEELQEQKAAIENSRVEFHANLSNAVESFETSRVVEESLLALIDENKTKYTSELSAAESKIASLQSELSHLRNVVNALRPQPPTLPSRRSPHISHTAADSAPLTMPDLPVRSDSSPTPLTGSRNGYLHSSLGYMANGHPITDGGILAATDVPSSPEMRSDSGPKAMRVQMSMPGYLLDKGENTSEHTGGLDGMRRGGYGYQGFDEVSGIISPHNSAVATHPIAGTLPAYTHKESVVTDETTLDLSQEENPSAMGKKSFQTIANHMRALGLAGLSITTTKSPQKSSDQSISHTDNNGNIDADAYSSRNGLDDEQNGVTSLTDDDGGTVRHGWNFWL